MGGYVLSATKGTLTPLRSLLDSGLEGFPQGFGIGAQPPAPVIKLHAADLMAHVFPRGRDAVHELVDGEVIGRPTAGANHRQGAAHGLEDRQTKALAAVRVHQAVTGRVKTGQFALGQFLIEVNDFRGIRIGLRLTDPFRQGLSLIGGLASEILDDQTDIVGSAEGGQVGFQEQVGSLAGDGSAHEEELEFLAGGDGRGGSSRMVHCRIVAVGQDLQLV